MERECREIHLPIYCNHHGFPHSRWFELMKQRNRIVVIKIIIILLWFPLFIGLLFAYKEAHKNDPPLTQQQKKDINEQISRDVNMIILTMPQ